ncbi:uncharacterized protein LOC119870232 isoform X1 [Canis lupus familiaris]|uniref:uncharacterized protein LOC119870232 isoform X1 n=1 Tax=Canis lupus familiaris TaxID=9615 RepID=UPI0018F63663|nr:uncharacterized protein LOC119870232 isoform X1 [Canis lupus familiaris]
MGNVVQSPGITARHSGNGSSGLSSARVPTCPAAPRALAARSSPGGGPRTFGVGRARRCAQLGQSAGGRGSARAGRGSWEFPSPGRAPRPAVTVGRWGEPRQAQVLGARGAACSSSRENPAPRSGRAKRVPNVDGRRVCGGAAKTRHRWRSLDCQDLACWAAGTSFTERPLGALITGRAEEPGSLARADSSMLTMVSSARDTCRNPDYRKLTRRTLKSREKMSSPTVDIVSRINFDWTLRDLGHLTSS